MSTHRILTLCFLSLLIVACNPPEPKTISGLVLGPDGPIAHAVVRVKTTKRFVNTDANGRFSMDSFVSDEPVRITAWAKGYFIGGEEVIPGSNDVVIKLAAHASEDNPDYQWLSAFASSGNKSNCQNCHSDASGDLLFEQWLRDAHSQSAKNPRFLSMYAGTDLKGKKSPLTRYAHSRDYGTFPLRPDLDKPYYGPGYKLDFPNTQGNCAACHAPAAAVNAPYETDPTRLSGVGLEGVACDVCHKVWDVKIDHFTKLPHKNMPGVLSFKFRRPPEGHQFFSGPLDDVDAGEDTFSPLYKKSQFCAACHFGTFWDTVIYNSFGEWLESPYSDPKTGKSCQDCHMPTGLSDHFVRLDKGGQRRDPATIFSHHMPGAGNAAFLKNAVSMTASARRNGNTITVEVVINNEKAGHHVPTDSPLRHMILLVQTRDKNGQSLRLLDGPRVPKWGGKGDPEKGHYAGFPGKIYAKILQELWTEVTPTAAYWNPTRVVSDNRIPAMQSDSSTYTFDVSTHEKANVEVKLIFRRAFIKLMDQKGWNVPDIVMAQQTIHIQLD